MELADWLGDGDGKLRILFFHRIESASYFLFTDLAKVNYNHEWANYSNNSDMIYISNALLSADYLSGVIAHELAHKINYLNGLVLGRPLGAQDLWINEGLATGAEWLYHEGHPPYRWWRQYNLARVMRANNIHRSIGVGNVFWNTLSENPFTDWPDYFTPYLFFTWLRLQAGTTEIWHDMITSGYSDYRSITAAANKHMPDQGYDDWGTLFRTWLAATYINAPYGPLGYMNDSVLKNIRARTLPPEVSTVNLVAGDGVFSMVFPGFTMPPNTENIRYVSLRLDPPALSETEIFPDGVLLTYNVNTNIGGLGEDGIATVVPAVSSTVTKFEGEWVGSLTHSPEDSYGQFIFTGNTFAFRSYQNGRVIVRRQGIFTFTDADITFIPARAGSWEGYTLPYTLSGNDLFMERNRMHPHGVLTRQQ